MKIQRLVHGWKARKIVRQKREYRLRSIITIQRVWRGFRVRLEFNIQKYASLVIQQHWRNYRVREELRQEEQNLQEIMAEKQMEEAKAKELKKKKRKAKPKKEAASTEPQLSFAEFLKLKV